MNILLFSDSHLTPVMENKRNALISVNNSFLHHNSPYSVVPLSQYRRLLFQRAYVKCHSIVLLTSAYTFILQAF